MLMFESLQDSGGGEPTIETITSTYTVSGNHENAILIINRTAFATQSNNANYAKLSVTVNGTSIYNTSTSAPTKNQRVNHYCVKQRDFNSGDVIKWSWAGSGIAWSSEYCRFIYS